MKTSTYQAHILLRRRLVRLALAALALAFASIASRGWADASDAGWRPLYQEHGVLVSVHEVPGVDLPGMRGQTLLNTDIDHLLAILLDDKRSLEWAKGADETRVLRKLDANTQLIYAHAGQPWPVRDRDLIMKRRVDVLSPGQAYRVHLICVPDERPELADTIRVRQCETSFVLRAVDKTHTRIDYRVQADPGGKIPAWMVRSASRSIPLDTLVALAKQIELTRGHYKRAPVQTLASN